LCASRSWYTRTTTGPDEFRHLGENLIESVFIDSRPRAFGLDFLNESVHYYT